MKKYLNMRLLPLLIASSVILLSCDKKATATQETSEVATPNNDSTAVADTITANAPVETMDGMQQVAAPTVTTTTTSPATVTTVAPPPSQVVTNQSGKKPTLNPAHGQPFHRCDIQVGAPIDSAPQQNPAPQMAPQQSSNSNFNTSPIAPAAAPVQATGPKPALNPAHGQPHHRCDLQVGAPLT